MKEAIESLIALAIVVAPFYFVIRFFRKRSDKKVKRAIEQLQADEDAREIQQALYKDHTRRETQERLGNLNSDDDFEGFDIFNDPHIDTEAKANRNNPLVITFIYNKEDRDGKVIAKQERAIMPYYRDDEYLEGYCLDREEKRTFRIDRIARFTGNSEAIFDEMD